MKLLVHELKTTLTQRITIGKDNIDLYAIRPYLLFYAAPAGSLKLQVRDLAGNLVAESETLSVAAIKAAIPSLGHDHGFVRFLITVMLRKNTQYDIVLVPTGYSFNESAYVGWCNGFDLAKVGTDYTPSAGWSSALNMEFWGTRTTARRVG